MYVDLLKAMFIALKKTALLRSTMVKPTHIMVFSVILPCSLVHEDLYFGENCTHPVPPYPCTRLHGITTHMTTICAIKAVKITGLINISDLYNKGTNESTLIY
jgi:hypothetical protein